MSKLMEINKHIYKYNIYNGSVIFYEFERLLNFNLLFLSKKDKKKD